MLAINVSSEWLFSALRSFKNHLCSKMSQEHLDYSINAYGSAQQRQAPLQAVEVAVHYYVYETQPTTT